MPAPASGLWPGMAGTRRLTPRATNIFASPDCEAGARAGAFQEAPERYGTAGAPRPSGACAMRIYRSQCSETAAP